MLTVGPVSPVYDGNPSFRIFEADGAWAVNDWKVYSSVLADADSSDSDKELTWAPLYSMREQFALDSIDNRALRELAMRFSTDRSVFDSFMFVLKADCNAGKSIATSESTLGTSQCEGSVDEDRRAKFVCLLLHGTNRESFDRCLACRSSVEDPSGCASLLIFWTNTNVGRAIFVVMVSVLFVGMFLYRRSQTIRANSKNGEEEPLIGDWKPSNQPYTKPMSSNPFLGLESSMGSKYHQIV